MVIFGGWFPGNVKDYPLEHLCLPFLVWAALRFDQRVLTAAVIVLAGVALWGTSQGYGPFVHGSPNESLLLLQAFVASSTLMALILFAVISERKAAEGGESKTCCGAATAPPTRGRHRRACSGRSLGSLGQT